jgi:hypothetical protein
VLVTNKYEKDTVVSFKILNGDEIVAKVIDETDDAFIINKPTTVMPSQKGLGLIQSLFTSEIEKNIQLSKQHIMMHSPTVKDVEDYYIQTTTGIQPVSNGGIIT